MCFNTDNAPLVTLVLSLRRAFLTSMCREVGVIECSLIAVYKAVFHVKLEIRSVERGICPIATYTMNELFL